MAFTVTRNDGPTTNAEFEAYSRLLQQQGVGSAMTSIIVMAYRFPSIKLPT